jgi:putative hydrolase of HD superfamily
VENHSFLTNTNLIKKNISFIVEVDKLKAVYRKALVMSDNDRFENSAEHSWHTCITLLSLHQFFNLKYDINHTLKLLLIHDIVEIYAGDTFAFDEVGVEEQNSKELKAINKLKSMIDITDEFDLNSLWLEFNLNKTNESIVANSIDKITPFILNYKNNGGTWRNIKIHADKIINRNKNLKEIAPELWNIVNEEVLKFKNSGLLI